MRIFLWRCVALLTAGLLLDAIPGVAMPEFRRTRQGRDILFAELGVAIVLGVLLSKLLGRPEKSKRAISTFGAGSPGPPA